MSEVASPCIGLCDVDGQGVCRGCDRTLAEIAAWSAADAEARRAILLRVAARRAARLTPP